MKKKILVIFQDWGDWFTKDYHKFEFWFKHLDRAYSKDFDYYFLVFGNLNKKIKTEKNITVEIIKSSSIRQFLDFPKFKRLIKQRIETFNPDKIYVPFLYLACLLPKKKPQAIGFLRDIAPEMIKVKGGIRYFVGLFFYFLDYLAMQKLDIILHNGKSLENYAKKQKTTAKLIYNSRPLSLKEKFKQSKINVRLNKLKLQKKKIILSVSRLVKGKNLEMGVKALINLPKDYVFVIVGEGELKVELIKRAKDLGVENRVYLEGYVKREDIWSYYKGADIFWLLSKSNFEGTPNVIQEAFYSRVPVVVSKISAMRNIVDRNCGFILNSWNPKELAYKTKKLMNNKEIYKKFQKNGFEKVNTITKKSKPVTYFFEK